MRHDQRMQLHRFWGDDILAGMWIILFLSPRQMRRKNFHLWSAAVVKTKQTSVVIYYWNRSLLGWLWSNFRKRKNGMILTRTNFKLLNSILEKGIARSNCTTNYIDRPEEGKDSRIRGAISWNEDGRRDAAIMHTIFETIHADPAIFFLFFSSSLFFPYRPLFFTAHVLIISSRSRPSLSRFADRRFTFLKFVRRVPREFFESSKVSEISSILSYRRIYVPSIFF